MGFFLFRQIIKLGKRKIKISEVQWIQIQLCYDIIIFIVLITINMLTLRLTRNFGRIHKPKLSKYQNIHEIARDRSDELAYLQSFNQQIYSYNKNCTLAQQLSKEYGITEEESTQIVQGTEVYQIAHDPITHEGYIIKEKIGSKEGVIIDDRTQDVHIPYSPDKSHLKFHQCINKAVPKITDLPINKNTAYIFNLPSDVTEKQIMLELGFRFVKNVTIKYCLLGLPAYAVAEFVSQNSLTDKIMKQQLQVTLNGRPCPIVTHIEQNKLSLDHRQIALHNIESYDTPASILRYFSKYGRIINFQYPQKIYREPSIQQIKEIYKDSEYPINIRYHRKNSIIEEQFYPEYKPSMDDMTQEQMRVQENNWRFNFSQVVDVYEGEQGKIKVKGKGFCLITYACVQQAQNCYFRERLIRKCELVNGKSEFEFDQEHRKELLRYIDHQFIENKKVKGEHNMPNQLDSQLFQNFYHRMTIQTITADFYSKPLTHLMKKTPKMNKFVDFHFYRQKLIQLQRSIGSPYKQREDESNIYGKSFNQLAEQQLFRHKLPNQSNKQRYQIDFNKYEVDQQKLQDYDCQPSYRRIQKKDKEYQQKVTVIKKIEKAGFDFGESQTMQDKMNIYNKLKAGNKTNKGNLISNQDDSILLQTNVTPASIIQKPKTYKFYQQNYPSDQQGNEGKRHFSTSSLSSYFVQNYREKTLEEKIHCHIEYNRFVRNTINQYMGVFPNDKLEEEFNKKRATYTNPQNLKFKDGSPFLPESYSEMRRIVQFSSNVNEQCQQLFNVYVKENQRIKSMNEDVEQLILKDLKNNQARNMMLLSEMGIVKEEFEVQPEQNAEALASQLNKQEAEFGQEYKALKNQQTGAQSIVKVVKLDHIYPLHLRAPASKILQQQVENQQISTQLIQAISKNWQHFVDGQQLPEQIVNLFNLEKGEKFSMQIAFNELRNLFEKYGYTDIQNKDIEKLLNLENYTPEQIQDDLARQSIIKDYKQKFEPVKASDYSKDPSNIYVRDKNGKFRVSKFRQM